MPWRCHPLPVESTTTPASSVPGIAPNLKTPWLTYERETTHQVVVLTVKSLGGESIESVSLRVTNVWALGRKGLDNGVLVTLAPAEHQVRIKLGTGMNRYVSNAAAKAIIEETMLPTFRAGDIRRGLRRGVERLLEACRAYKVAKHYEQ
jgi:uncharacterized protein